MTNTLKTTLLLGVLSGLFLLIGEVLGGAQGVIIAFLFAAVTNLVSYWFSDRIVLAMYHAKEVGSGHPLFQLVAELAQRAQLPMPRVYVIPDSSPNAFATGRNPSHAAVAATEGILQVLDREELAGVLAHELAHVLNRDVLVTTVAAMIGAAITAVAHFLQFSWLFGGDEDESPLGIIGTIAAILIAPIAAMILQLAVSRQREYLADATAARMLGTGEPLAQALENLDRGRQALPMQVNPATEALYIVNPFNGKGMTALFSTHPPLEERVARLREYDRNRGFA